MGAVPISVMSAINAPHSHPKLRLAGPDKVCHAKEFADAMLEPTIEQTIVDGANIIGGTLLRLVENPTVLEEIVAEFNATK